jgi:hypothetical protein
MTTKTRTIDGQTSTAELELFAARRTLSHLVEMYDNGQWRLFYEEEGFVEAVRQARYVVEHWTEVLSKHHRDE